MAHDEPAAIDPGRGDPAMTSPDSADSARPEAPAQPVAAEPVWPGVSVIMAVLDEQAHLAAAVAHALAQDYAGPLEVVIAVGPSDDRTAEVADELSGSDSRVHVVPNPTGRTATGLNLALSMARHDIVVRIDGHALIPPDYVRVAVDTLASSGADNVGGVMAAEGETTFERAVARGMTSKLGVGSASFHVGGQEGPALTVYLGAFRRSALDRVGGYDEDFVRAQDWELNHRIRQTGGTVWFTPKLVVTYRPRPTVGRLARQYYEYGRWRRALMRSHEGTVSLRYLAAPAAVVGGVGGAAAGLAGIVGPKWLLAGWALPLGYLGLVGAGGLAVSRGLPLAVRVQVPKVLATMHLSWGVGFLTSPRSLVVSSDEEEPA
jgi:succinoglycan biosynthesis protein ExoA